MMTTISHYSMDSLKIDAAREVERIGAWVRATLADPIRRRGVVLGISGGIDSSVVAAVCVRALGPKRVLGIFMPERDSDPESLRLGRVLAGHLGIQTELEDIAPTLEAAGCYVRRDHFMRRVFPEYGEGWKSKIVLGSGQGPFNLFMLVVQTPGGELRQARLPFDAYMGIVAATNMKQRTRKQIEYYHADRLNFAVAGTPNRQEYEQGFFVKNGDGAADLKPIAHLYKSQVYQLAEFLGLPAEIQKRQPTTDTYSLGQSQEEFYFSVPHREMDICLFALNNGVPAAATAAAAELTVEQVERVFADIISKRKATHPLHLPPLLVEPVTWETDGPVAKGQAHS